MKRKSIVTVIVLCLIVSLLSFNVDAAEVLTPEEYKEKIFELINIEREKEEINLLEFSDEVSLLADVRAEESSILWSHARPNGRSRFASVFYTKGSYRCPYKSAGENLSRGYSDPTNLFEGWMESDGHRENMLSDRYECVGIGYFKTENGKIYCSLLLFTPRSVNIDTKVNDNGC